VRISSAIYQKSAAIKIVGGFHKEKERKKRRVLHAKLFSSAVVVSVAEISRARYIKVFSFLSIGSTLRAIIVPFHSATHYHASSNADFL